MVTERRRDAAVQQSHQASGFQIALDQTVPGQGHAEAGDGGLDREVGVVEMPDAQRELKGPSSIIL